MYSLMTSCIARAGDHADAAAHELQNDVTGEGQSSKAGEQGEDVPDAPEVQRPLHRHGPHSPA